jgi:hypothetical protein
MILKKINRFIAHSWQSTVGSLFKRFTTYCKLLTACSSLWAVKRRSKLWTVYCLLLTVNTSCGIYSFKGATLSPDIKSVTIVNFTMSTAGGPANMALQFNEKMKEYYQRNTSLTLLPSNGDMQLEGTITGYEVTPTAPTANDQAAFNRLTITIQVKFTNNKDEEKNFDQSFSFFKDFPQSQTLSQVESRLIPTILDQIVQDIFNKSAGDW